MLDDGCCTFAVHAGVVLICDSYAALGHAVLAHELCIKQDMTLFSQAACAVLEKCGVCVFMRSSRPFAHTLTTTCSQTIRQERTQRPV